MKFSSALLQGFVFAVFSFVTTSLMAGFIDGEQKKQERPREQQQERIREAAAGGERKMRSVEEDAFDEASSQLDIWSASSAPVESEALNQFVALWTQKITGYGEAYDANVAAGNSEAMQKDLAYFNASHEILDRAVKLKEMDGLTLSVENSQNLNARVAADSSDQGVRMLASAAQNDVPDHLRGNDRRMNNAADVSIWDTLPPMPSLKHVVLGAALSFLSYRMIDKHIPNFLSTYCAPYSDAVASWHPCSGFPDQEKLNQLAAFKMDVSSYIQVSFPLVDSLVVGDRLIEDPSMYYDAAARSVDCGEGKTFCYAFLPKETVLIEVPQGVNCATYNTSCYEKWGSDNKVLKYYQGLESRLQQKEKKFSAFTFHLPSERGYYASRAWSDFSANIENIKNIYAAARLTASAKKEATVAFIARQIRTALMHDQAARLSDGAVVISDPSQKIGAALYGEKDQYEQAMGSWNKAREAYERGLAAAPRYEKEEWFSKEHWRHYLQDVRYRIAVLQYWQSHTLQRVLQDDFRRVSQFDSKKPSDSHDLLAQNKATHSQFTETVGDCYQLVDTITRVDSYSPYRLHAMMAKSSAGNITTLKAGQLYEVIAQRVKILCDIFQKDLQENTQKNQRSIEALKASK